MCSKSFLASGSLPETIRWNPTKDLISVRNWVEHPQDRSLNRHEATDL